MKTIKISFYVLILVIITITGSIIFFTKTTPGLAAILSLKNIRTEQLHGSVIDGWTAKTIRYTEAEQSVTLSDVTFSWQWREILQKHTNINLYTSKVDVKIANNSYKITKLSLRAHLTPEQIDINNMHFFIADMDITTKGNISWQKPYSLNIKIIANGRDKSLLPHSHTLINARGSITNLKLSLKSSIQTPISTQIKANANITPARATINAEVVSANPALNLQTPNIDIALTSKAYNWRTDGIMLINKHKVKIDGTGIISPSFTGKLNVSGSNLRVLNTPEYVINISPSLTVSYINDDLDVHGTIVIPSAIIKPTTFTSTDTLTDDAVLTKKTTANNNSLPISADVQIIMGDDVQLAVQGLTGKLSGSVTYTRKQEEEPEASGVLQIIDGKYNAYGQKLNIDEGKLTFTGALIANPALRVLATRKINNTSTTTSMSGSLFAPGNNSLQNSTLAHVTVGIDVRGRLKTPKIKLFSKPANISQADILSLLILGKPAAQASSAGGQLLLNAVSAMNLDSGAKGLQLMTQLQDKLGLDVAVNAAPIAQPSSGTAQSNTSVSISKKVTDKVYLSYTTSLFQDNGSIFIIKYLINKFLSVQVTTSETGNGVDLTYTHRKE